MTGKKRGKASKAKQFWDRRRGTMVAAMPEGPEKVRCTIREKESGRVVAQAEGSKTKKRSAFGAAKSRAVSELYLKMKAKGVRLPNLDDYEIKFAVLETQRGKLPRRKRKKKVSIMRGGR